MTLPLITLEELAAALETDPAHLSDCAVLAIDAISSQIRDATDRTFDYVEADELTTHPRGTNLLILPEDPVYEITEVAQADGAGTFTALTEGTDYTIDYTRGAVWHLGAGWPRWTHGPAYPVRITYTHGYALPGSATEVLEDPDVQRIPATLRNAALRAAGRAITNPTGIRSETVGRYTAAYGFGTLDTAYLTASELVSLHHYRRPAA